MSHNPFVEQVEGDESEIRTETGRKAGEGEGVSGCTGEGRLRTVGSLGPRGASFQPNGPVKGSAFVLVFRAA